jgi:hypothetical protein
MWCAYPDPACPGGYRYSEQSVGDGLAGECVPADIDAGVDAPIDGMPLNCPQTAPVQNGQAADLVLGQPDFASGSANHPFLSGSSLSLPEGILADDGRLWVSDAGNARVLQWNSFPAVNGQSANIELGQADLIHTTGTTTQTGMKGGGFVARTGTKLIVSDDRNNRVLIWNSIPTTSAQPADVVLGQPDFTSSAHGNSASAFESPSGVWTDGTRLIVADRYNNRVLIWSTFPTTNGAPADVVLGTTGFGMTPVINPPTASSLRVPEGVAFDGSHLFVVDQNNHRVLVWDGIPTTNNAPADLVLGQSGFDSYVNNAGAPYPQVNAVGMKIPNDVFVDECGSLYVCDNGNGRVMVWTKVPTTNGTAADVVLGKPDPTAEPNATVSPSDSWMDGCGGLSVSGASLYASDATYNRVLRFSLSR